MSTAGLFVLFALTIGVLAFIAWPLMTRTDADSVEAPLPDATTDLEVRLQRDYDATLVTLRDLDFDFQTGKLTEVDYYLQREALVTRGADLLRQIDTLNLESVESVIESAVADARAHHTTQAPQPARKRIEAALASQGKPARTPAKVPRPASASGQRRQR